MLEQLGPVAYVILTHDRRKVKRVCHVNLALQQRFQCTEGYYRKQFKTARTGESQKSLVDRITLYLRRWVEMSGLEMTVEGD